MTKNKKANKMGLIPITEKNFRKKLKGCGIKNYGFIPEKELKEKLGYCPTRKQQRKVTISDDYGFEKTFKSMSIAAKVCQISFPSVIKRALDKNKKFITRQSDRKKFYIQEIDSEKEASETVEKEASETAQKESFLVSEKDDSDESDDESVDDFAEEEKLSNFDFESETEDLPEIIWESDSEPDPEPDSDSDGSHSGSSSESESESNCE